MPVDPDPKGIDWDGIFTFLLTLLVVALSFGLLWFLTYLHTLNIARSSRCAGNRDAVLLVFGKRLQQDRIDHDYRLRLDKALELLSRNPKRSIILLGGSPGDGHLSEARAGQDYLEAAGLPEHSRIQLEEHSRNTLQNLKHARELLRALSTGPVLLITNRYHLARSRMIARSLAVEHDLCPAEATCDLRFSMMRRLVFEAFYILWFSTGKTWARLTRSERMLKRVT
ncbi:MAG: YdcF family protein [Gammaproteobacteria bacterium]|nr:YdcF family protein [Gammaproteobacteria bacterium]